MEGKQGFVRLNPRQKEVLELVKPFDGNEEFFPKVRAGQIGNIAFEQLVPILGELQDCGYLTIIVVDGEPRYIALSSWAFCYRHEYLVNVALPALVNGLAGVSGGLVVWLLTRLF